MNELMVRSNELFGEVRFLEVEGKLYAVANDVLRALGYAEGGWSTTLKRKCKGVTNCKGLEYRGNPMNLIPEGDIYRLIVGSKLSEAEKFERWVFDEVLPQIRQTSGYIPIQQEDSEEEIMAKALLIAQKTIEKKNELIKNLQPKADWFDKFMNSDGLFTSTQIAKMINYPSAQKLNKELNELKICYKKGRNWMPYANVDETWYKVLTCEFNGTSSTQLKFTPIGVFEICKLLNIELKEDILG